MRLKFKRSITMIVQNIMLVGEVFQIEVSDGSVHQLGSCQNINLYPAGCLQEHEFLGVCMRLQILMITPISVYKIASSVLKHFKKRFHIVSLR